MKTGQTNFKKETEYQSKVKLFKQVFIFQMQLEDCKNQASDYEDQVNEVIRAIDELMMRMIER